MSQIAMFSADTDEPALADVAGLLAANGQSVHTATGARVSVVVADQWRADVLVAELTAAGLESETVHSDEGSPMARTLPTPRLTALHRSWSTGAVKTVPPGWIPTPRAIRLWVIAGGHREGARYLLALDPHAPDTHPHLATALMRVGIAPIIVGARGGSPALCVTGKRRLTRLSETIGPAPTQPGATSNWPAPQLS
ncbi:hypothetical protein [Gordonia sp. CPCC 205333]|uniref:hypothetical protein n=1 Tax=Gordonia sp. CPCC 205333 TaxID=3140790 RepID=UPI003AF3FFC7